MDRKLITVRVKEWKELLETGELFNDNIYFKEVDEYFTEGMKRYCGLEIDHPVIDDPLRSKDIGFRGYKFTPQMYEVVSPCNQNLQNHSAKSILAGQLIEVAIRGNRDTYICIVQYNKDKQLCFSSQYCSGLITHLDEDLSIRGDLLQVIRIWDRAETETAWSLDIGNRELLWERKEPIEYRVVTAVRFGKRESIAYAADVRLELQQGDIMVVENYEDRDEEEVVKVLNASYSEIEEEALYIFPKVKRKHKI